MARIPFSIGERNFPGVRAADTTSVGRALTNFGAGVSDVGSGVGRVAAQYRERAARMADESARAEAEELAIQFEKMAREKKAEWSSTRGKSALGLGKMADEWASKAQSDILSMATNEAAAKYTRSLISREASSLLDAAYMHEARERESYLNEVYASRAAAGVESAASADVGDFAPVGDALVKTMALYRDQHPGVDDETFNAEMNRYADRVYMTTFSTWLAKNPDAALSAFDDNESAIETAMGQAAFARLKNKIESVREARRGEKTIIDKSAVIEAKNALDDALALYSRTGDIDQESVDAAMETLRYTGNESAADAYRKKFLQAGEVFRLTESTRNLPFSQRRIPDAKPGKDYASRAEAVDKARKQVAMDYQEFLSDPAGYAVERINAATGEQRHPGEIVEQIVEFQRESGLAEAKIVPKRLAAEYKVGLQSDSPRDVLATFDRIRSDYGVHARRAANELDVNRAVSVAFDMYVQGFTGDLTPVEAEKFVKAINSKESELKTLVDDPRAVRNDAIENLKMSGLGQVLMGRLGSAAQMTKEWNDIANAAVRYAYLTGDASNVRKIFDGTYNYIADEDLAYMIYDKRVTIDTMALEVRRASAAGKLRREEGESDIDYKMRKKYIAAHGVFINSGDGIALVNPRTDRIVVLDDGPAMYDISDFSKPYVYDDEEFPLD